MKVKLVFDDWRRKGQSVYGKPAGVELAMGHFHSGTTFDGEIELDDGDARELLMAMSRGFTPIFYVMEGDDA